MTHPPNSQERAPMTTDTKPLAERLRAWPKQAPTAKELVAAIVEDCIEAADALDAKDALLREAADVMRGVLNSRLKSDFDRARSLLLKLTEATKP